MKYLSILFSLLFSACIPQVNDTNTLAQLELPSIEDTEDVYYYSGFTSSYNHTTLVPNWVAYELTAEELDGDYNTRSSNFSRDPNVKGRQASREDYSRSGWDKGHMAPKADMRWSESAYWESHYFTNVCPQNHEMNAGDWNYLEKSVRRLARKYNKIWVVCGPIFDSCTYGSIGQAQVQIPDRFFKALLIQTNGEYHAIAFIMPNSPAHHKLESQAISVDELEATINRDLFCNLPDSIEPIAEAQYDLSYWK